MESMSVKECPVASSRGQQRGTLKSIFRQYYYRKICIQRSLTVVENPLLRTILFFKPGRYSGSEKGELHLQTSTRGRNFQSHILSAKATTRSESAVSTPLLPSFLISDRKRKKKMRKIPLGALSESCTEFLRVIGRGQNRWI